MMLIIAICLLAIAVSSKAQQCGCTPENFGARAYNFLKTEEKFQGDITLTNAQKLYVAGFRNTNPTNLWTGRTVYYTVTQGNRATIDSALSALSAATGGCLKFVYGRGRGNYVDVVDQGGCHSYVGMTGGRQELSLGNGCMVNHIIQHEFLHAAGFYHEQSRRDRAQYVTINWDKIMSPYCFAFHFFGVTPAQPYDVYSIMHYESWSFACQFGAKTITDKQGRDVGGTSLTSLDIAKIKELYKC